MVYFDQPKDIKRWSEEIVFHIKIQFKGGVDTFQTSGERIDPDWKTSQIISYRGKTKKTNITT